MKVLTESGLMGFARAIAENDRPTEQTVRDLFAYYCEEVSQEWKSEDIAFQALNIFKKTCSNEDTAFSEKNWDEIVSHLVDNSYFVVYRIHDRLQNAWDARSTGVSWETVEWAIFEVHTRDELEVIVKNIIEEMKKDDVVTE